MTSRKNRRNRRAFGKVSGDAGPDEQVCATLDLEGTPAYFVMPTSASDAEVREAAFRVRNGRDLSGVEKSLIRIVERDLADAQP